MDTDKKVSQIVILFPLFILRPPHIQKYFEIIHSNLIVKLKCINIVSNNLIMYSNYN